MRTRVTLLALATMLSGGGLLAQDPVSVSGVVVDGVTGSPLAGVRVEVVGMSGATLATESTDGGRFVLNVPPAESGIGLRATGTGYLQGFLGQAGVHDSRGASVRIPVRANQAISGLRLRLWPESFVTGRVTLHDGRAAVGARVFPLVRTHTPQGTQWLRTGQGAVVDDRGVYRLERLVPGEVLVAVQSRSTSGGVTPVVYHPGVAHVAAAAPWTLSGGENILDLTLPEWPQAGGVVGRLVGADRPLVGVTVQLVEDDPDRRLGSLSAFEAPAAADGQFRFTDVVPGAYRVVVVAAPSSDVAPFSVAGDARGTFIVRPPGQSVIPPLPTGTTWITDFPIVVEEGRTLTTEVPLRAGGRISGHVVFDGMAPPEPEVLLSSAVVVRPLDGGTRGHPGQLPSWPQGRIEKDGSFQTLGLPDGEYTLSVMLSALTPSGASGALRGWSLMSVSRNGDDVPGALAMQGRDMSGVVLTMTTQTSEIGGQVTLPPGRVGPAPHVIVFAKDLELRRLFPPLSPRQRVAQVVVDVTGAYRVMVPPGDYFVAIAPNDLAWNWMAPDQLRTLEAGAIEVRVVAGGRATANLTVR